MTAKESFEQLGFEKYDGSSYFIWENDEFKTYAAFTEKKKEIETTFYPDEVDTAKFLRAVTKQLEELGWSDKND